MRFPKKDYAAKRHKKIRNALKILRSCKKTSSFKIQKSLRRGQSDFTCLWTTEYIYYNMKGMCKFVQWTFWQGHARNRDLKISVNVVLLFCCCCCYFFVFFLFFLVFVLIYFLKLPEFVFVSVCHFDKVKKNPLLSTYSYIK